MKFTLLLTAAVAVASEDPLVIPLNADNVHWGYFSKNQTPIVTIASGQGAYEVQRKVILWVLICT